MSCVKNEKEIDHQTHVPIWKDWFPFNLDTFQTNAIDAIINNKHALVTAHTGSGKTIPAEFSIQYFHQKGKRVIYTSPIKSLSNQKYHEFTNQFPHISFGILTGDIKYNPDADVLIMTTEILRNILIHYKKHEKNKNNNKNNQELECEYLSDASIPIRIGTISFQIDMNDVACIIFDEVHYINDQQRGKVWEECIMNAPSHTQLVMLSATIDRASYFASWVSATTHRPVEICGTNHRVVPLVHYSMLSVQDSTFTKIASKDPKISLELNHTMIPIKEPSKPYREKVIHRVHKIHTYLERINYVSKSNYVLNDTIRILRDTDKLPAICFVFSRKKAEEYARHIQINLHDTQNVNDDTRKTSRVHQECQHIIRKLTNHNEYSTNQEYQQTIKLLEKGIAVHHSGVIPVLREMIELLFSKGYIKCLFATETFAVGINMPTKSVIFTSLTKYDGIQERYLYSHEYTQMAGRAGRRGLDTIGHVIHLHSMFPPPSTSEYSTLLSGKPQTLKSKFMIDFSLVIRCVQMGITKSIDFLEYFQNSMLNTDMTNEMNEDKRKQDEMREKVFKLEEQLHLKTNPELIHAFQNYIQLDYLLQTCKMKSKQYKLTEQKFNKERDVIQNEYCNEYIEDKIESFRELENVQREIRQYESHITNYENYFLDETTKRFNILNENGFISIEPNTQLTPKGLFSSYLQECNCLIMGDLYQSGYLHTLSTDEMVQVLSCFTDIRVRESQRIMNYEGTKNMKKCLDRIELSSTTYHQIETSKLGYINEEDYYFHYDMIDYMRMWIEADDEEKTKYVLNDAKQYDIFQGEFVKAVLKINSIAEEIESFCDEMNDLVLKEIVHSISEKTLKYIATNQSLYV